MSKHAKPEPERSRAAAHREDPYSLLEVSPTASDSEIRWAYERAINRAQRIGALQLATDIARAYEAVSTPRRRELYARHGMLPLREDPRRAAIRQNVPAADLNPSRAVRRPPTAMGSEPDRSLPWPPYRISGHRISGFTWWAVGLLCGTIGTIALLVYAGELAAGG